MKRYWLFIILLFTFLSCKNSKEEDSYKIYNTVLKEKVSTYGIILNYIHFPNDYSMKETDSICKAKSDSLYKTRSLNFYLHDKLSILDTLNPSDEFHTDQVVIEFKPKYSKNKIDFSKITEPTFAKRLNNSLPIDENQKNPTYLGNYDLSEPIFISKDKAVIRYQHYCGGNCGVGILIYLKKINNEWEIIKEKEIWIS